MTLFSIFEEKNLFLIYKSIHMRNSFLFIVLYTSFYMIELSDNREGFMKSILAKYKTSSEYAEADIPNLCTNF